MHAYERIYFSKHYSIQHRDRHTLKQFCMDIFLITSKLLFRVLTELARPFRAGTSLSRLASPCSLSPCIASRRVASRPLNSRLCVPTVTCVTGRTCDARLRPFDWQRRRALVYIPGHGAVSWLTSSAQSQSILFGVGSGRVLWRPRKRDRLTSTKHS